MNAPLLLERPQSLTDLAYERLREGIVVGELKLGEQVSEAQLAQRMGISKTPVREALVRLKMEGLVDIYPQRGTFVFKLTPEQVGQLCRYRAMIEVAALREAAVTNRKELIRRMREHMVEMVAAEKARDVNRLSRIDMNFHHEFLNCCANPYLRGGYELIRYQLIALRHRSPIENMVDSHQILVDALERKDVDTASTLLHEHVLENEARYSAACAVS
ncbi:GntR family transcriptional regulator [Polaromonas sp. JS666]|uniref:GntR family transcriptional regulator n=1 Tax=Polaromonas sp. (strain JS666 / ATCC BAA-500) TaxID=296591 RepID=UPI0000464D67|nr:GntR family transcriptional regulator [Polaromonas sp. JS666]ABE46968.1 transcriptional regulator, GntR family [Polaromonas sp. JS666]